MNKVISACLMFAVLLLSGCAHYSARSLRPLTQSMPQVKAQEKKYLLFNYKIFTADDSTLYLGRDLLGVGVQPLQIEFINNSGNTFYISEQSLNLPCLPVESVAQLVHTDTHARVTWYGVASLFLAPFLIPAVVDGIGSATANRKLDDDFARKALGERFVPKYGNANGIVFVPAGSSLNDVALTVVSQETDEFFVLTPQKPRIDLK